MIDFLAAGEWLPAVKRPNDACEYGGVLIGPADGSPRALAILVHGIAGDAGRSAYFLRMARVLRERDVAVLLQRADGYVDSAAKRRVVRQGDASVFVDLLDRTIDAADAVLARRLPIIAVPHSLGVAKMVAYTRRPEARHATRIRGFVAVSPVNIQTAFGRPPAAAAAARTLTRVGLGGLVVSRRVVNGLGRKGVDWDITVEALATLGAAGGPFDCVELDDVRWLPSLAARLHRGPKARAVLIGELDELIDATGDRIRAFRRLVEADGTWPITVVEGASHSLQRPHARRGDEGALLIDSEELTRLFAPVIDAAAGS